MAWHSRIIFVVLATSLIVFAGALAAKPAANRSTVEQQSEAIHHEFLNIAYEESFVKAHASEIDQSRELREEEARSLKLRFPDIILNGSNAAEFQSSLSRLLLVKLKASGKIDDVLIHRETLEGCQLRAKIVRQKHDLYASKAYSKMSLEQRLDARKRLDSLPVESSSSPSC